MEVMDVLQQVAVVEDPPVSVLMPPLVQAEVVQGNQQPKLEAMERPGQDLQLRYQVQRTLVLAVVVEGSLAAITI
jgi:hypothetical protein